MLEININEHSQGPHWLSGSASDNRAAITELVSARLHERFKDRGKKKTADPNDEKSNDAQP